MQKSHHTCANDLQCAVTTASHKAFYQVLVFWGLFGGVSCQIEQDKNVRPTLFSHNIQLPQQQTLSSLQMILPTVWCNFFSLPCQSNGMCLPCQSNGMCLVFIVLCKLAACKFTDEFHTFLQARITVTQRHRLVTQEEPSVLSKKTKQVFFLCQCKHDFDVSTTGGQVVCRTHSGDQIKRMDASNNKTCTWTTALLVQLLCACMCVNCPSVSNDGTSNPCACFTEGPSMVRMQDLVPCSSGKLGSDQQPSCSKGPTSVCS